MAGLGQSRDEVDAAYRTLEDRVFAELVYPNSRTCCWNSTTPQMYAIAMDLARTMTESADHCLEPPVFMMVDGGYEAFEVHAETLGLADQWVGWSADESCPQADTVETDTRAESEVAPLCP